MEQATFAEQALEALGVTIEPDVSSQHTSGSSTLVAALAAALRAADASVVVAAEASVAAARKLAFPWSAVFVPLWARRLGSAYMCRQGRGHWASS